MGFGIKRSGFRLGILVLYGTGKTEIIENLSRTLELHLRGYALPFHSFYHSSTVPVLPDQSQTICVGIATLRVGL